MKYVYEVVTRDLRKRVETFTCYQELRAVDLNTCLVEVYSGKFTTNLITTLKTADEVESWIEGQERADVWPKPIETQDADGNRLTDTSLVGKTLKVDLDEWDPFRDTDIQLIHTDASILAKDHLPYITNQIEEALTNLVAAFKLLNGQTPSKAVIRAWLRDDTL